MKTRELFKSVVIARDFNWIGGARSKISAVRVRHERLGTPCSAMPQTAAR